MPRRVGAGALPLLVLGMGGLGDGIYQRPLVRAQAQQREVYLTTPWPELYADLAGVHPVRPFSMDLRTQKKHVARVPLRTWARVPNPHERRCLSYQLREPGRTILAEMESRMGAARGPVPPAPLVFDLPDLGGCPVPVPSGKRLAVLRPSTLRAEWTNAARAPRPEYLFQAGQLLLEAGYHVVAVADIEPPQEWLEGKMPPASAYYVHGELTPPQVLALVQRAAVTVGGVGWLLPASVAAGTPMVCIAGGQGGHNAPEKVVDPRMGATRLRWIMPPRYCRCTRREHACSKEVPDFPSAFTAALAAATAAPAAA